MSGPQPTSRNSRQPGSPSEPRRAGQSQDLDKAGPHREANDGNAPRPSPCTSSRPNTSPSCGPSSGPSMSAEATWLGPMTFREAVEKTREAPVLIRLEEGWRGDVEQFSLSSGDIMALEGCIVLKGNKVVMAHYVENHEDLSRVLAEDAYRALVTLPLSTLPDLEVSVLQDPAGDLYRNFVTGNFGECSWETQRQQIVGSVESGRADYRDYVNKITVMEIAENQRQLRQTEAQNAPRAPGPGRAAPAPPPLMASPPPVAPPRRKKNEQRPPPLLPRCSLQLSTSEPRLSTTSELHPSQAPQPPPRPPRAKEAEAQSCAPTVGSIYNVYSSEASQGPKSAELRPHSLGIPPIAQWDFNNGNDPKSTYQSSETRAVKKKIKSPQGIKKDAITSKAKKMFTMATDALVQGLQTLSTQPERTTADDPEGDYVEIDVEEEYSSSDDNYASIDDTKPLPRTSGKIPPIPESGAEPAQPLYVCVPRKGKDGKRDQHQLRVQEKDNRGGNKKEQMAARTAQVKPTVHVPPRPQMPIPPTPPVPSKASHPMMAPIEDIYEVPDYDVAEKTSIAGMSCSDLYDRLVQCGMAGLAHTCRSKKIDGRYFMTLEESTLKKAPFSCDDFEVSHKIVQIKAGWVPKREDSKSQMNTYTKM